MTAVVIPDIIAGGILGVLGTILGITVAASMRS